ncbi:MAG: hypothetical protein AAFU55_11030, partial [Pseudomonadota bacterium]
MLRWSFVKRLFLDALFALTMLFAGLLLLVLYSLDVERDAASAIATAERQLDARSFEEAADTLEQAVDDIPKWMRFIAHEEVVDLLKAHGSIGDKLLDEGRDWRRTGELYRRLLSVYDEALETERVAATLEPVKGLVLHLIAVADGNAGDLEAALEGQRRAVAFLEEVRSRRPSSAMAAKHLGFALIGETRALAILQRGEEAKREIGEALEKLEGVSGLYAENAAHRSSLLAIRAFINREAGDLEAARDDAERAVNLSRETVDEDALSTSNVVTAEALGEYALSVGALGAKRAEAEALKEALELIGAEEPTPQNHSLRLRLTLSLIRAHRNSENYEDARAALLAINDITPQSISGMAYDDVQNVLAIMTVGIDVERRSSNREAAKALAQQIIDLTKAAEKTFGLRGFFALSEGVGLLALANYRYADAPALLLMAEKRLLSIPSDDPSAAQIASVLESVQKA